MFQVTSDIGDSIAIVPQGHSAEPLTQTRMESDHRYLSLLALPEENLDNFPLVVLNPHVQKL